MTRRLRGTGRRPDLAADRLQGTTRSHPVRPAQAPRPADLSRRPPGGCANRLYARRADDHGGALSGVGRQAWLARPGEQVAIKNGWMPAARPTGEGGWSTASATCRRRSSDPRSSRSLTEPQPRQGGDRRPNHAGGGQAGDPGHAPLITSLPDSRGTPGGPDAALQGPASPLPRRRASKAPTSGAPRHRASERPRRCPGAALHQGPSSRYLCGTHRAREVTVVRHRVWMMSGQLAPVTRPGDPGVGAGWRSRDGRGELESGRSAGPSGHGELGCGHPPRPLSPPGVRALPPRAGYGV